MSKIVIWGHRLHESTHGYVHSSYKKACEFLGHETLWIDHRDDISSIDFSDSIFIVEHSRRQGMPYRKDCKYVGLNFQNEFEENNIPKENVIAFRHQCDVLDQKTFKEKEVEKISDLSFWDESSRTLYQAWATDLLPHEIDHENPVEFNPRSKKLNYIGMLYEQGPWWAQEFANIIGEKNGVEFTVYTQNASDEENRQLIRESFLCPDFRSDWHLLVGYIPCRIFKNISYGRICGTNSHAVKREFGDYVVYGGTPQSLYENLLDAEVNKRVNMNEAMLFIKEKHTYVNRVQNILKLFGVDE